MAAADRAIYSANPEAKVLGLNMAFCDVLWAEKILRAVPYDCFDIACFHPYRPPCSPNIVSSFSAYFPISFSTLPDESRKTALTHIRLPSS